MNISQGKITRFDENGALKGLGTSKKDSSSPKKSNIESSFSSDDEESNSSSSIEEEKTARRNFKNSNIPIKKIGTISR